MKIDLRTDSQRHQIVHNRIESGMQSLWGYIECSVRYDMCEAIWDMLVVEKVPIFDLPYFLQADQVGVRNLGQLL